METRIICICRDIRVLSLLFMLVMQVLFVCLGAPLVHHW